MRRRCLWGLGLFVALTGCGAPPTEQLETPTPVDTDDETGTPNPGPDIDGDGWGANEECDDAYDETHPGADEVCDGRDNDCDGDVDERDEDGDGYIDIACGGNDCDDSDEYKNPGEEEICNEDDENCDGQEDEGAKNTYYQDADSDGYGDVRTSQEACWAPSGYVADATDCRDTAPDVYPGATEQCNGIDDDCNNDIDDGLETFDLFTDNDGDGFGDEDTAPIVTCDSSVPQGYSTNGEDCDDRRDSVYPGAPEVCNGRDDDCDGFADLDDPEGVTGYFTFFLDLDDDGFGLDSDTVEGCTAGPEYAPADGDCDDADEAVYPGADEACDGKDNDCDDQRDEDDPRAIYYLDSDGDGFGVQGVSACLELEDPSAAGLTQSSGDCDDTSATIHPGADDPASDGVDKDCGGHDGPDPHVGLSEDSLSTIQAAIDQASDATTVWVGPGEYLETDINFAGKAIALRSTRGSLETVINANGQGRGFLFTSSEDSATLLQGFTIQDAQGVNGGGIYLSGSSPVIAECRIIGARASDGGGLYLVQSHPRLADLSIDNNAAESNGGGMYLQASSPIVSGLSAVGNVAGERGGGVYLKSSSPQLAEVELSGNSARSGGGAYIDEGSSFTWEGGGVVGNDADQGGGLYLADASPALSNVVVSGNSADMNGGGIYAFSSTATFRNVRIDANETNGSGGGATLMFGAPSFAQVSVTGNTAASGAGLHIDSSSPTLSHVVVTGNVAESEGGGVLMIGETTAATFLDSIIAYNVGDNVYEHPIYAGTPVVSYSLFYNPFGLDNHNLDTLDGTNLEVEPGFLAYDEEGLPSNLHLASESSAVDAGDPELSDLDGSTTDLGIYGGSGGGGWDLDRDGAPDYFWPGTFADSPEGVDSSLYDVDDSDPDIQVH